MYLKGLDFSKEEEIKRDFLGRIMGLSPLAFHLEKWEELKRIVYRPKPLKVNVIIDDTTLRDGLQMAGLITPRPQEMCRIACLLRDIGIERLEVMIYTKTDQEAIKLIQNEGMGDMIAAWCRAAKDDVDLALRFDFKQIGISHPVSYIHFAKWHDKTVEELVSRVVNTVEYAREHGLRIFVHGEDSTRADWEFEKKFINAIADAGANVYRVCDTIGCGLSDPSAPLPFGIPEKIKRIRKETKIKAVEIHCHDDLGNAVENTMAAIRTADGLYDEIYASTVFAGIGERAGNAETEKVIMNCYLHHDVKKWNIKLLRGTARFIAKSLHYHLPLNKAIVGDSAFSHESGIHVHGVRILPLTYEIIPPELVGHKRSIIVGKRSGKHGIQMKIEELLGTKIDENDPRLIELVEAIKKEYVEGCRVTHMKDSELLNLARKVGFKVKEKKPQHTR